MSIPGMDSQKADGSVAAMKITSAWLINKGTILEEAINEEHSKEKAEKVRQPSVTHRESKADPKETKKTLEHITEGINGFLKETARHLSFNIHEETGHITVQVISEETGDVIREIPPSELLDIAARIQEMVGVLIDEEV